MKRFFASISLVAAVVAANAVNLIQNGSFEIGTAPGSFTTVNAGGTNVSNWTVVNGSIDYIGSYWQASDGVRSLDLGGNNNGTISQTFATIANQTYVLTFDLSGNPDQRPTNPAAYIVNVTAGDLNSNFSFTDLTNTKANMKWQTFSTTFTATGALTTLTFVDYHPQGAWGPALDNVYVAQAVPEPFTIGLGLAAAGAFARRKFKAAH